jgi:two-component system, LytTR family, response regulator
MKGISTILVDDERVGRSRLRRLLEKEPDIEILSECGDGTAAFETMREHVPDLLFLDINMPGMDGFDVLEALGPERQPRAVIFVTAYDEHAVRAFEACALDYVLKPVSPDRLAKALTRVRERLRTATLPGENPAPVTATSLQAQRFIVRSGGRMNFVAPDEIDWAEAAGNYVILHVGIVNHMIRETMSGMETRLATGAFLRVSRSAIVNLRRVKELYTSPGGDQAAILADGQRINVTRCLREVAERLAAL